MNTLIKFILLSCLGCAHFVHARDYDEIQAIVKRNRDVRCKFSETVLVQTLDGRRVSRSYNLIFKDLIPAPSSSSDLATYSIDFDRPEYSFYYSMNTQVGEIRIKDKRTGASAESDLDLSDLDKEEVYVGAARLEREAALKVKDPQNGKFIDGKSFITLLGDCSMKN